MAPNKPTGMVGPLTIRATSDGSSGGWNKIEFPNNKEGIEKLMVEMWASAIRKAGGSIIEIIQNKEDDFDFTLVLPGGTVSLDLVELIYSDGQNKPYEGDGIEIKVHEYAEQIFNLVMKKSGRYGSAGTRPIHLLVYITHWRFWTSEIVIRLAQYF